MKQQEFFKLINITKTKDETALKKLVTEKISHIVSSVYNKS